MIGSNENFSDEYVSPGRKRLIKKKQENSIDWDINQDLSYENNLKQGSRVFHKKFGYGKVLTIENDSAEVQFEKSSNRKVFIKFLQISI